MSTFAPSSSWKPSTWLARLMLLMAAAAWGAGYTFEKVAMETLTVRWLMGIRILCAIVIMTPFLLPRLRRTGAIHTLVPGLILGVSYWAAFSLQMMGLTTIAPGRNSFLTATYCIFVPFLVWIMARRRPALRHFVAAAICILGVALISLPAQGGGQGLALSTGDLLTLAGALLYGVNLVITGFLTKKFDAPTLTYLELLFGGILFLICALIFDPFPTVADFTPSTLGSMIYLTLISTLMAQNFQNIAFSRVPAAQGSLILCSESLFGMLVSVLVLHEELTATHLLGFAIIFAAIILSEVRLHPRRSSGDSSAPVSSSR
ncbi:DMT family transporter [Bifidobacterium asteroides]|uniref:EamA family transporter n=1 Tax=Bifidobacterium asteroides TaxID=1684 RepID=A0A6N7TU03_9BIFI|nr:DMT family transporter [Bifidobacterium asteroides]MSD90836.1 EamA family transporter [Bifidobacterium asteroides]